MRVGVIGLGLMGTALTQRFVDAGLEVLAYDVDEEQREASAALGAKPQSTLSAVIAGCEVNVIAVFDTSQVEDVIAGQGGALDMIAQGDTGARTFIVTTTCDPERLSALAQRVAPGGVRVLEVPISGSSGQVAKGEGVGLVGGDPELAESARTVLDAICPQRHYLGAVGQGSRAKLAVNLILGLNRAAVAEGLVFACRLGLDPIPFLQVARASAAYSQVMDVKGELMARREYDPAQSRVDQSLKDFKLMLAQARASGQALPFAATYVKMLEDCVKHGEAAFDNAAIAEAISRQRNKKPT